MNEPVATPVGAEPTPAVPVEAGSLETTPLMAPAPAVPETLPPGMAPMEQAPPPSPPDPEAPKRKLPPGMVPINGGDDAPAEEKSTFSRIMDALTASGKVQSDTRKWAVEEGLKARRGRELRKEAVDQELTTMLGQNYDPDGEFGMDSAQQFIRMADVARSASLVDQLKKFRAQYPDGDLLILPTSDGDVAVARTSKSEPYLRVTGMPELVAALGSEPVAMGTAGAALGAGLPVVGPFIGGVVGTTVGTIAGVQAQAGIETLRGYGTGEGGMSRSLQEGLTAAAFDLAFRGTGRAINAARGVSPSLSFRQRMDLAEVVEAVPELGLVPLAVGQTGSKFSRGLFRQVGATSQRVEDLLTAQEASLLARFRELSSDEITSLSEGAVRDVVRAQHAELQQLMVFPILSRMEAGDALQAAMETYRTAQKAMIGDLYDTAMAKSADVTFILKDAQAVARDIRVGVRGKGKETTEVLDTGVLDASGAPITRTRTKQNAVKLATTPQGELKQVIDDLLELDPIVQEFTTAGKTFASFEQIKTLRTRLFDLKSSDEGAVRREASRLWKALTAVMDSPVSGDPGFVQAYKTASGAFRVFEDTMDKSFIARTLKSDTPEKIIKSLFLPGNEKALRTLRDILPPEGFKTLKQGFIADVLRAESGKSGLNRLNAFAVQDPRALRVLLPKAEEDAMRKFLTRRAQFETSPAQGILSQQFTDAERVVQIAFKGTAGELTDAVAKAGGRNSAFARTARAGVYRQLLNDSTVTSRSGTEVLDTTRLLNAIEKLKATDRLSVLFDRTDWHKLEMFRRYAAPISEASDVGGGMMAGSLRARAVDAPTDIASGGGLKVLTRLVRPLYSNDLVAKILSTPTSYAALTARPSSMNMVSNGALALFLVNQELNREEQRDGDFPRKATK